MRTAPATARSSDRRPGHGHRRLRHEQADDQARAQHRQAVEGVLTEQDGGHQRHHRAGDEGKGGSHPVKGRLRPVADDPDLTPAAPPGAIAPPTGDRDDDDATAEMFDSLVAGGDTEGGRSQFVTDRAATRGAERPAAAKPTAAKRPATQPAGTKPSADGSGDSSRPARSRRRGRRSREWARATRSRPARSRRQRGPRAAGSGASSTGVRRGVGAPPAASVRRCAIPRRDRSPAGTSAAGTSPAGTSPAGRKALRPPPCRRRCGRPWCRCRRPRRHLPRPHLPRPHRPPLRPWPHRR